MVANPPGRSGHQYHDAHPIASGRTPRDGPGQATQRSRSSSLWPDQLRCNVQQPGAGRSMVDGPGPPATDTVAVRVLPASVALMTSGSGATNAILDTHRILLPTSGRGGECRASRAAHMIATMLSASPITCGMA